MGVFLNLLIGIQKLTINIKDLFAKLIGILASLLYVLSGSLMTMNATWAGPPGQMVRFLCFYQLYNDIFTYVKPHIRGI